MGHRKLYPDDARRILSPDEVLRRLKDEFEFVEGDREAAKDHIGDMLVKLLELSAPQEIIDRHRRAEDHSIQITIDDDPADEDARISFVAMPGEPLFVGFCSAQHEKRTMRVLKRCAKVLGYRIHYD